MFQRRLLGLVCSAALAMAACAAPSSGDTGAERSTKVDAVVGISENTWPTVVSPPEGGFYVGDVPLEFNECDKSDISVTGCLGSAVDVYLDGVFVFSGQQTLSCGYEGHANWCNFVNAKDTLQNVTPGPHTLTFNGAVPPSTLKTLLKTVHFTKAGVVAPAPAPSGPMASQAHWSFSGPIGGQTCLLVNEPADPDTWGDNYLCFDGPQDWGFRWSYAGPIPGESCLPITEPADPNTWTDNYLCMPRDYGLRWSYAGPVAGMACIQINEPADPDTWSDNYLCFPN